MIASVLEFLGNILIKAAAPLFRAKSTDEVDAILGLRLRDVLPKRLAATVYREAAERRIRERGAAADDE